MQDDKVEIEGSIKVRTYTLLSRAIEEGVEYGLRRAYKHTDKPDHETFLKEIMNAVMSNIDEVFVFPEMEDHDR